MFKKTDKQLVQKALKGNSNAWVDLVKRYEKLVFNYGLRMLPSRDDALDLLQETFVSVFKNLPSWRQDNPFKPWLMTIAHRRCVEYYRRRRQDEQWSEERHDEPASGNWSDPEYGYSNDQKQQHLVAALQRLPIEQRAVIEAKFFRQLTTREIALQHGDSENTVKSRLYSGVEKLQNYLEGIYEPSA